MLFDRRLFAIGAFACLIPLVGPAAASADLGDFGSAGEFKTQNTPYDIGLGDFDSDGTVDVAVPNANSASVTVLLGDGDGTFTEASGSPVQTSGTPRGIAVGDFDGDGASDFAVSEDQTDSMRVMLSNGDGTFDLAGTPVTVGSSPARMTTGQFDAGTTVDVALEDTGPSPGQGSVYILLGNGTGGFTQAPDSPVAAGAFTLDIAAGQINADGKTDLVATNLQGNTATVLLGDGDGTFTIPVSSPEPTGGGPEGVILAQLDGNPGQDLAIANTFGQTTSILLGDNAGDFTAAGTSPEQQGLGDVAAADFDGDSDQDLVTLDSYSTAAILLNNGSGDFSLGQIQDVKAIASRVATADTDNDGDMDVLVSGGNGSDYAVTSLLNNEPDGDSDGFLDVADECPEVVGTVRGCPFNPRTVTLKYKRRAQAFKGIVTSAEPACVGPGVRVPVFRQTHDGPVLQGKPKTDAAGRYKLTDKVKRGRFSAEIPSSTDPDTGVCDQAFSGAIIVKPK